MSIYAKDSTVTFVWTIAPTGSPPVKADFDIEVILPGGAGTYDNDGITTFVAPTATVQGSATFDLTLALKGLYQITLSIGTNAVNVIQAERSIYSVVPPAYVLNGPTIDNGKVSLTQGPNVIPPTS